MTALFRAELLKQRSMRTGGGLFAAMVALVLLAEALHGFALPADTLARPSRQLMVLGRGEFLAALFGALLGALSITSETRHGTIRPTFLVSPSRHRVVAAKVCVSALIGTGFGLAASAVAVALGTTALRVRGIEVQLDGGDYVLLLAGSAVGAALWAAIGVGVGSIVRSQVPTLIGLSAWLLFVEGLFAGDLGGIGNVGRFLPGAAAAAISGQEEGGLLGPAPALIVLVLYAAAATLAGRWAVDHRDVA